MYVPRILEAKLQAYLPKPEIIAITGPRQVGKTTLMRRIYKKQRNAIFITFEDQEIKNLFDQSLKDFIELYIEPYSIIFIDEFQYSKHGGKHLKLIFDTLPGRKIIISGSSTVELTVNAIKYLVGRIFVFRMYPFSFSEFLHSRDSKLAALLKSKIKKYELPSPEFSEMIMPHFKNYLIYGGYPRLASCDSREEKQIVLKNIYNTYLLRDVKELIDITDDYKLQKLVEILALQTGNMLSYSNISNSLQISHATLNRYLDFLEKTFIIQLVRPFFTNKQNEIVKTPKLYFIDNGLRNSILNNFNDIERRSDKGMITENFHFNELMKREIAIKYWRTKAGAEVDFVLEQAGKITAVEIKSNIKKSIVGKSLYSFFEKYKPARTFIFSNNYVNARENSEKEITYLPHWMNNL